MTEQRIIIASDIHAPYHDKRAVELLCQAAQHFKPTGVVLNGDIVDLYSVSLHDNHNPQREHILVKEIEKCSQVLDLLDFESVPKWVHYNGGNHEYRLDRHVMAKAPALWGAVKLEVLLKFEKRNWSYLPYSEGASPKQRRYFKIGKLWLAHDMGSSNETAHANAARTFGANIVIGHGHRVGYQIVGNIQGKPHFGAMTGHLMDTRYADYVPHVVPSCLWQQGFAFAYIDGAGFVDYYNVPIVNKRCRLPDGKVLKA